MIPATVLLITSFFLFKINYLHCVLSQGFTKVFHVIFTTLYIRLLNDAIVDIERLDEICLSTFAVDEFSKLFLHPSIFSFKHSRSA